jgi:MFS family permease
MPLLISSLISRSLIAVVGYYNPYMYLGMALMITGSSLIFTLSATASQAQLIAYQFIAGFGISICRQIPYSSVSIKLPKEDLAVASALWPFAIVEARC